MAQFTYNFCPQCRSELTTPHLPEQPYPACPSCDFVYVEDPKVAVIAFITCQDRVLLIQRGVRPQKGKWALPGGYMDAGELPEEALQREALEEVGLEITVDSIIGTQPLIHTRKSGEQRNVGLVLVYAASPKSGELEELSAQDDVMAAAWFSPGQIPQDIAFDLTKTLIDQWQTP